MTRQPSIKWCTLCKYVLLSLPKRGVIEVVIPNITSLELFSTLSVKGVSKKGFYKYPLIAESVQQIITSLLMSRLYWIQNSNRMCLFTVQVDV